MKQFSFKNLPIIFSLIFLLLAIPLSVVGLITQKLLFEKEAAEKDSRPTFSVDFIRQYEPNDKKFTLHEIGPRVVYFHQRKIGEALVEKDFINYQFDKKTGKLLKKIENWRDDLPKELPKLGLDKQRAESMAEGETKLSRLYFISPKSDVFPFKPTPKNPCWIVSSQKEGRTILTVVDAITGSKVGLGIPPPSRAFSFSGPQEFGPCQNSWNRWYQNAQSWFERMGYITMAFRWPDHSTVIGQLVDDSTSLFYAVAHGDSFTFINGCQDGNPEYTFASELPSAMSQREKLAFAFLANCDALCQTEANTFSYELRKGSNEETAVLGYCHMGNQDCDSCWSQSVVWQNSFFEYLYQNSSVKEAFDLAMADRPACLDCLRFSGDENFHLPLLAPTLSPTLTPTPTPITCESFYLPRLFCTASDLCSLINCFGVTINDVRWDECQRYNFAQNRDCVIDILDAVVCNRKAKTDASRYSFCSKDDQCQPNLKCQIHCPTDGRNPVGECIPANNPVLWQTDNVLLKADNFYASIFEEDFLNNTSDLTLFSDPATPTTTNLKLGWFENNREFKMNFFLEANEQNWWVAKIEVYNAQAQYAPWIQYTGRFFETPFPAAFQGNVDLGPDIDQGVRSHLHFENLYLQPFFTSSAPTP